MLRKFILLFKWEAEYHVSPFHFFLASLIIFPIFVMRFSEDSYIAILYLLLYVIYSVNYYIKEAKENEYTVWESIKNDLPLYGGLGFSKVNMSKVSMPPWQIILFLFIAAPFLFFFGSIVWAMLFG